MLLFFPAIVFGGISIWSRDERLRNARIRVRTLCPLLLNEGPVENAGKCSTFVNYHHHHHQPHTNNKPLLRQILPIKGQEIRTLCIRVHTLYPPLTNEWLREIARKCTTTLVNYRRLPHTNKHQLGSIHSFFHLSEFHDVKYPSSRKCLASPLNEAV